LCHCLEICPERHDDDAGSDFSANAISVNVNDKCQVLGYSAIAFREGGYYGDGERTFALRASHLRREYLGMGLFDQFDFRFPRKVQ